MSGFDKRRNKAKYLTDYLDNYLIEQNIPYFESGYEFYKEYNNAFKISYLKDTTSQFVRYYPDYTIVGKDKTILIEVKNSSGIEKECFKNYSVLSNDLNIDILLLCKNKKLCSVKDLVFQNIDSYDSIADMNIPITDSIWKEPRKMNETEYFKYLKAYNYKTSGCSFAFIDFNKTKFYELKILKHLNYGKR